MSKSQSYKARDGCFLFIFFTPTILFYSVGSSGYAKEASFLIGYFRGILLPLYASKPKLQEERRSGLSLVWIS